MLTVCIITLHTHTSNCRAETEEFYCAVSVEPCHVSSFSLCTRRLTLVIYTNIFRIVYNVYSNIKQRQVVVSNDRLKGNDYPFSTCTRCKVDSSRSVFRITIRLHVTTHIDFDCYGECYIIFVYIYIIKFTYTNAICT